MRKDSDIQVFKKMIKHQSPTGIDVDEWERLNVIEHKYKEGDIDLKFPTLKILFCFSNRGRLKGIVNYKQ